MSTLYLVGVPIGNWGDITLRALETLKNVDVIACEDTRKAGKMLEHYNIKRPRMVSHHAHNEHQSAAGVIKLLQEGKPVAYISDAGMPAISDPGYLLARNCRNAGIKVDVIPGVSAVTTSLLHTSLPNDRFVFAGFLPTKANERKQKLQTLSNLPYSIVIYEAPHRLIETMDNIEATFGNRNVSLCRELTKVHEEVLTGNVAEIRETLKRREQVLGECVLILEGKANQAEQVDLTTLVQTEIDAGLSGKQIKEKISGATGIKKNVVYAKYLELTTKN